MEGMPATEKPELEDNQDGIRRRLRDRDLLKKRKAEAQEKATTQWVYGAESKKRVRGEKSSSGRRGRPRKTNQTMELSGSQEDLGDGGAILEEVPKPVESNPVCSLPSPPSLSVADNTQLVCVPLVQASLPILSPAPVPVVTSASGPVSSPASGPVYSSASGPVSSPASGAVSSPASGPVSSTALGPVSAAAPETLYTDSDQASGPNDQVLIEDLGPDEEEDVLSSRDDWETEQGSNEQQAENLPEQNRVYSTFSMFSSGTPSQDSLTGNFF
ncbi:hypothetical protein DPEC_G00183350 [Dallia pectoralis]|uniref:Uncharacterized protein n=1 Tax=Dallia pectoralis TaxID=75939 RepID=A0ACC2GAX4_DALPE|nr:hypothetical protein DPEC_G00183350 [Dallia pectoralis]